MKKKTISTTDQKKLLETLAARFEKNMGRHKSIEWKKVEARLKKSSNLYALWAMEESGGEPDVTGLDKKSGEYIFMDCSTESPAERRSLCYDRKALDARKANKPKDSVEDVAREIGIELLTEEEYRDLQKLGKFDTKTSSWIQTPDKIRELGGALFCDRRFEQVFTYHNGAESYYAARGFRGKLKV